MFYLKGSFALCKGRNSEGDYDEKEMRQAFNHTLKNRLVEKSKQLSFKSLCLTNYKKINIFASPLTQQEEQKSQAPSAPVSVHFPCYSQKEHDKSVNLSVINAA